MAKSVITYGKSYDGKKPEVPIRRSGLIRPNYRFFNPEEDRIAELLAEECIETQSPSQCGNGDGSYLWMHEGFLHRIDVYNNPDTKKFHRYVTIESMPPCSQLPDRLVELLRQEGLKPIKKK